MTAIVVNEFFADPDSTLKDSEAKKYGPAIHALSEQGGITPRDVLDAARSSNSPLHDYFEWDDRKAADQYRLEQARYLLKSVKVRFIEDNQPKVARAFQIAAKTNPYEKGTAYRSFEVLHGDTAFAAQMMENAVDDLTRWRLRYEPYAGMWTKFGDTFQSVINQISEFEDDARVVGIAGDTDAAMAELLRWRERFADGLMKWTMCREHVAFIMDAIRDAEETFGRLSSMKPSPPLVPSEDAA